jgi:hypothetical protein
MQAIFNCETTVCFSGTTIAFPVAANTNEKFRQFVTIEILTWEKLEIQPLKICF